MIILDIYMLSIRWSPSVEVHHGITLILTLHIIRCEDASRHIVQTRDGDSAGVDSIDKSRSKVGYIATIHGCPRHDHLKVPKIERELHPQLVKREQYLRQDLGSPRGFDTCPHLPTSQL